MSPLVIGYALLALIVIVALWPWLLERFRTPMNELARGNAPGELVELSQGNTHYQWHGPRAERIIVLVHGLSTPSWVFSGLINGLLGMRYRVLTYDLYGRGYSDRVRGKQSLEFHTQQLSELLDAVGITVPVTLLGYSMGGAIASKLAADEPDRIERLILIAPAGLSYNPSRLLAFARKNRLLGGWLWGVLGRRQLMNGARSDAKSAVAIPDLVKRMRAELRRRGYLGAILSSERHTLSQSLQPVHSEISAMYIPTLAIWGRDDAVIPIQSVGQLAAWNRKARQEVVEGAGHGLTYTHPEEVLAVIRDFLREVPD